MSMTIEQFQAVVDTMFPGLMGVRLTAVALDKVSATMRVRPDMCTSGKTLHGGAFMAFADTLGAIGTDRKSTRLNSSHLRLSRMPSSA